MKRKTLISLFIALILVVGVYFAYRSLTGAATGTVSTAPTRPTETKTAPVSQITEQGKYATFTYPSYFTAQTSDPVVAPVLVNYNFIKQQLGSWQLAIQITSVPSGNLNDDSAYQYRKAFPGQYAFTSQTINSQSVPLATDKTTGGFNEIAFLAHSTMVATVSLMGGNGQDSSQMQTTLTSLLSSWQWH